jgi:hypothetical protein
MVDVKVEGLCGEPNCNFSKERSGTFSNVSTLLDESALRKMMKFVFSSLLDHKNSKHPEAEVIITLTIPHQ